LRRRLPRLKLSLGLLLRLDFDLLLLGLELRPLLRLLSCVRVGMGERLLDSRRRRRQIHDRAVARLSSVYQQGRIVLQ
jgi:hypothetical protein